MVFYAHFGDVIREEQGEKKQQTERICKEEEDEAEERIRRRSDLAPASVESFALFKYIDYNIITACLTYVIFAIIIINKRPTIPVWFAALN